MKIHKLKTWLEYYEKVWDQEKNFEVRKNDRDYQVGDILSLIPYDPNTKQVATTSPNFAYLPSFTLRRVMYILQGGSFGIEQGTVIMGIRPLHDAEYEMIPKEQWDTIASYL